MKTIYKYPLEITDLQTITLPKSAQILSVESQPEGYREVLVLYALIDTHESQIKTIDVRIYGTGYSITHDIENTKYRFLGTVKMENPGILMWHVFIKDKK